jgi:polar amino acid transport system substrate-binding protein
VIKKSGLLAVILLSVVFFAVCSLQMEAAPPDREHVYAVGGSAALETPFSFSDWVKTGVERNLITENRWKLILNGLGVTMLISVAAQIFGTLWGSFVCFVLLRKNKLAKRLANLYCSLIYGTPAAVLLMIAYYIIFSSVDISNILVAVAAFTMTTGASVAQNLKGAIGAVDPVEIEAAQSIGFSPAGTFIAVTMPQAVRRALPAYMNGFVELVKATAIVGFIAIQDLTRAGDIIRSRTYDAYFPLLLVALIYLVVTTVCVMLFKLIIKKINRGGMGQ